jgi:molybdate transport system ATP-binding protein
LDLLAGKLIRRAGEIAWPLLTRLQQQGHAAKYPSDLVHRVAFAEESRLFSYAGHYYQQRYNFIEKDEDLLVRDYLTAGSPAPAAAVEAAAERMGVRDRLDLSFLKLSNGQTRRVRLARARLSHPQLLLLDDPSVGLDAAGRAELATILREFREDGVRLIVATTPGDEPEGITHRLELHDGRIIAAGPVIPPTPSPNEPNRSHPPIVELHDVTVRYGEQTILDRVNWTVHAGERWAILGPNGSGKTTLLAMICGDHPQVYRNRVRLFGRQRGTGESIWDVKQKIGLLTPELHLYFREPLTALATVNTGWNDVVVACRVTTEQQQQSQRWLERLGLADLRDRPFARLSTGEQRLVLLARALVKQPPLLVLDEPFQALDRTTSRACRELLEQSLEPNQALLFVSHRLEDVPRTVRRTFQIQEGVAEIADFPHRTPLHHLH